ncbi:MAG: hypothetical protein IJB67_01740 [Firmicutes bacterium]|nr:hypothetical protein [Bacillota bacterium]
MQETSETYLAAVHANPRVVTPMALIDLGDPDAVYDEPFAGGEILPFCDTEHLHNRKKVSDKTMTTLEHNIWLLDGNAELPEKDTVISEEVAAAFDVMSGEDGTFGEDAYIEQPVSNIQVLQAVTLIFADGAAEGWPVEFDMQIYVGSSIVWQQQVVGNTERSIVLEGFTVYDPTAIRIVFGRWSLPRRRPRILEIYAGVLEEWTGADIYEMDVLQSTDLTNLTVAYGNARIVLRNENRRFHPRAKDSIFRSIEDRQAVAIYYGVSVPGGRVETVPVGVYYMQKGGWETAATDSSFTFNCVSIVGLLADRVVLLPEELPETVQGWVEVLLATVGENFTQRYIIDETLAAQTLTAAHEEVEALTCGVLLRYICMAIGAWYGADAATGRLTIQKISDRQGTYISLSEQYGYPAESAGDEWADITFKLANGVLYTVGGNNSAAEQSQKIDNPFIRTEAKALTAAGNILRLCGGSKFKIAGRGDPACELGDVDIFETIFAEKVTARRYKQQLKFSSGVMQETPSWHIQAGWAAEYAGRAEITADGVWTAPEGVTQIWLVLIDRGSDGSPGEDGTWNDSGQPGIGGQGGRVWVGRVNVTSGGEYGIVIGDNTTFGGSYTSADGKRYDSGWGDVYTGKVYAAPGAAGAENCKSVTNGADGEPGSGCGGQGGGGGRQGARAWNGEKWVYKRSPVDGGAGGKGAAGCAIIYY